MGGGDGEEESKEKGEEEGKEEGEEEVFWNERGAGGGGQFHV